MKSFVAFRATLMIAFAFTIITSLFSIQVQATGPSVAVDKTATVYKIPCGLEILVNLTVTGRGVGAPLDVMLVIDRSGTMYGAPLAEAKEAAKTFVARLSFTPNPATSDWVGVVSYATNASLDLGLTNNPSLANSTIDGLAITGPPSEWHTNIMAGVHVAQEELVTNGRENATNIMILMSDGAGNRWTDYSAIPPTIETTATNPVVHTTSTLKAIEQAAWAKGNGTILFTIGFNLDALGVSEWVARDTLQQMATSLDHFFDTTITPLEEIYGIIAKYVKPPGTDLTITDVVEDEFTIVMSSFNPPYTTLVGKTITWKFDLLGNETRTFLYKIRPSPELSGIYPTNVEANLTYTDHDGNPAILWFPIPTVTLYTVHLPEIESCNSTGARKDLFTLGDIVYVNGSGYDPSTTYDIYVVNDTTWTDGMPIPAPIPNTVTSITSDPSGNIPPTPVWSALQIPGKYDIVVDVDDNGEYNVCVDALDDNDIEITAGFFIIPEHWLGTILALVGCLAAFSTFRAYKHRRAHASI